MTEKITLTRDLTIELDESEPDGERTAEQVDGYVYVGRQEGAEHRSYSDWALIIRRLSDGQLFASEPYKVDLSPYQDHEYWCDQKTVEFHAVVAVPKAIIETEYVSADKVPAPEPEPDPAGPRQIAIDLIHQNIREGAMRHVRIAVSEQYDLKALGREGYAAKVEEVREHIIRATVTVEIPDEAV